MMLATFLFILLSKNSYETPYSQDDGKHIHTAYVLRVPNARYT